MMSFARLLSVFAIIAMISAPAMACCLTGHDDAAHVEIAAHHDSAAKSDLPLLRTLIVRDVLTAKPRLRALMTRFSPHLLARLRAPIW